jgi:hypothetical protein
MADMLMPGASRHLIGNTGAMEGGAPRATWHTTSNPKSWSYSAHVGYFTQGGAGVAPHLLWDPFSGEVAQFFPANSRALALKNAGDVRTNRTGKYNIQIEIVFTEGETVGGKKYASVKDTPCKDLDKVVAWLRSLGVADVWPGGVPTGFSRDTVSLSAWLNSSGHYGHNQVPGNDHVDPGPMPNLFGSNSTPRPTPTYAPYPGVTFFKIGRKSPIITEMGKALVRAGYKGYKVGPGPEFTQTDRSAVKWFQVKQGWAGKNADGYPGPETWKRLKVASPK